MIASIPSRLFPTAPARWWRQSLAVMVVCLLLVGLAPDSRAGPAEAVAAYERGDYRAAAREWLPLAAQGDREALYALGQLYRQGLGVEADLPRAERYYLRAAQRGHVQAQSNLGSMLYFKKPRPDYRGALQWWRQAARGGEAHALYMLGVVHLNGEVVPRDLATGYAYLTLAEAAGFEEAIQARAEVGRTLDPKTLRAAELLARQLAGGGPLPERKPVPQPAPATPPAPAATAGSAYLIQLGALGSEAGARQLWASLTKAHGDLLAELAPHIERFERAGGKPPVYRLRVGPFATSRAAQQRCDALKADKLPCFVAKAH